MRTYHYTSPQGPITVDPMFVAELIEAIPLERREEVLEPWRDFANPSVFGKAKKIIVDETQFAKAAEPYCADCGENLKLILGDAITRDQKTDALREHFETCKGQLRNKEKQNG